MPYGVPALRAHLLAGVVRLGRGVVGARHEADGVRHPRGVDVDHAGGIDRDAAPVGAAARERKDEAALDRRRRVEPIVAQRGDAIAAGAAIEEGEAERVLGAQGRGRDPGQVDRKRLRGRELLARRAVLRHGALLDRKDRPARVAIENEDEALLGRLHDDVARLAVDGDRRQRRLGGNVVVPDVVLDDLERPRQRAVGGVQGDDRVRVAIRAGPTAAEEIRARARRRHEDQRARFVDRHRRPRIGGAGDRRGLGLERLPLPARRARAHVEGAHAARRCAGALVVADRRADDHGRADDDRRRRHLHFAGPVERAAVDDDLAAVAERRTRLAGARVQRDQARVDRRGEDARGAGRARCGGRIVPLRDAAAVEAVRRPRVGRDVRIEAPRFGAGPRVERDDLVERAAEHQLAAGEDGRRLELDPAHQCRRPRAQVAGAVRPLRPQLGDVVDPHLRGRAVASAAGVCAVVVPRGIGGERLERDQHRAEAGERGRSVEPGDAGRRCHGACRCEGRS